MYTRLRLAHAFSNQLVMIIASGALFASLLASPVSAAGQWQPMCVEGSSCAAPFRGVALGGGAGGYDPIDPHAAGPLMDEEGIWLLRRRIDSTASRVATRIPLRAPVAEIDGAFGDLNALQLSSGEIMVFWLYGAWIWSSNGELRETLDWTGINVITLNNAAMTGPPVVVNGSIYVGVRGSAWSLVYGSSNDGRTWTPRASSIRIGDDRYNLLPSPDGTALWAIQSEFFELPASLWESLDGGATWYRIDDGSFPAQTVRIVHDPRHSDTSYALTARGLKLGRSDPQGRIHWQATSMWLPVHGLVFVDRIPPLSRALVIGTDTGVLVSVDEGKSWQPMASGLLAVPHTVTWAHGMLVATSAAGYFTCNAVDCAGTAQPVPAEAERGPVAVTEFYNRDLDHYFMTASEEEAAGIDAGAAGPGWERTGQAFTAWSVLGNPQAGMQLCRFYGSMQPGPNSHFYTLSTGECGQLMELQARTPATEPRWNFEGYAFAAVPSAADELAPCPEATVPVYRAYNRGFERGADSNHRYVTDRAVLGPLVARGWVDEGVAFCVAAD